MPPLPLKQPLLGRPREGKAGGAASLRARQQPDPFTGQELTPQFKSTEVTLIRKHLIRFILMEVPERTYPFLPPLGSIYFRETEN